MNTKFLNKLKKKSELLIGAELYVAELSRPQRAFRGDLY